MAKKKQEPKKESAAEELKAPVGPSQDEKELQLLKAKLKKKYHLLKDEDLQFDDKEALLSRVCLALGISRPNLDWVLVDL